MFRNLLFLILLTLFHSAGATSADTQASLSSTTEHFAQIGETTISTREYLGYLQSQVRQRYYHGTIPEKELQVFAREVGEKLIEERLLLNEAKRLNIQPDNSWIEPRLNRFIERNKTNPVWAENQEAILASARAQLEERRRLELLEQQVRNVAEPSATEVKSYYEQHPEKFTEPQRDRVSVILLGVDPGSHSSVWQATKGQAEALWQEIQLGADFAELASENSSDKSAANGGDMGYLHRGMLGEEAQKALDALKVGEVSKPIKILDGIILLRLVERVEPILNPLEKVKVRAADLLQRELGETAWQQLKKRLRSETQVTLNESVYEMIKPLKRKTDSNVNHDKVGAGD